MTVFCLLSIEHEADTAANKSVNTVGHLAESKERIGFIRWTKTRHQLIIAI